MGVGIQFYGHPNPPGMSKTVHRQISMLAVSTTFFIGLEAFFPHSLLVSVGRSLASCILGSWEVQAGYLMFHKFKIKYTDRVQEIDSTFLFLGWHFGECF